KRVMVSEAMTRDVHQINPTANLLVAQDLMEMDRTGGLPVVSDGRLIGMITRTDVLKVEPSKRNEKLVSDVMARELVTAYEDEDLFSALTRMITKGVGRLPVVAHDEHHMLIGIITRTDIANAIENHRLSKHSSLNS